MASSTARSIGKLRPLAQAAEASSSPNACRETAAPRSEMPCQAGWIGAPAASRSASLPLPAGRPVGVAPVHWQVPKSLRADLLHGLGRLEKASPHTWSVTS